jgi:tRNA A37 threonylcarbamoyladenosine modification protein TsaB
LKYSAAIDLSGKFAGFALAETVSGKILLSEHKAMQGRSSSTLCDWILKLMAGFEVTPAQIDKWTVGSGPGSFTGMRLVAALITGMTIGRNDVKARCVPSAIALANAEELNEGDKAATVFDGRNKEILLFELIKKDGELIPSGKTKVLNQKQAKEFFLENSYSQIAALDYETTNIEAVIPSEAFAKINWSEHLAFEKLIECKYKDFDNDLTALVYIRPAVFS